MNQDIINFLEKEEGIKIGSIDRDKEYTKFSYKHNKSGEFGNYSQIGKIKNCYLYLPLDEFEKLYPFRKEKREREKRDKINKGVALFNKIRESEDFKELNKIFKVDFKYKETYCFNPKAVEEKIREF